MKGEEPKRLAPLDPVARELYLKSGNECAFPGCMERIIDSNGVFIAELCHIEAALRGGERFNDDMSNEDRRAFSNLMLMCHKHHKITDDVTAYTVKKLQDMKSLHEAKFTDVVGLIQNSVKDHTAGDKVVYPTTLKRFLFDANANYTAQMLKGDLPSVKKLGDTLKELPKEVRQFLAVAINRAHNCGFRRHPCVTICKEIQAACSLTSQQVTEYAKILERMNIAVMEQDEEDGVWKIWFQYWPTDWDIWREIREFCKRNGIPLEAIVVDLQLNLLD